MDVVTLGAAKASAAANYGRRTVADRVTLASPSLASPAVMGTPPTIAWSTTSPYTLGTYRYHPYNTDHVTYRGLVASDNYSSGWRDNALTGRDGMNGWSVEFDFHGDDLVVFLAATGNSTTAWNTWLWVDGQPSASAPAVPAAGAGTPSSGSPAFMRITFASVALRRIRLYIGRMHFGGVQVPKTYQLHTTPVPPVSCVLHGDSFFEGGPLTAMETPFELMTGWHVYNTGVAGTGYVQPGTNTVFGNSARVAQIAAIAPRYIVIQGSINDDSSSSSAVGVAATNLYAALATQTPNSKLIVVGPQPTAWTTSYTAARLANRDAIRTAALAAPNVLGFVDPLGGSSTQAAWAGSTVYGVGDRATFDGTVYRCVTAHTSSGSNGPYGSGSQSKNWVIESWYTGTGRSGATASDGNRDLYLDTDSVHPTIAWPDGGSKYLAWRVVREIAGLLT